jgi:hypothetical protein
MIDSNLVRAIVDLALFLERSDDDTVEPDAAVDALENLAAHLQSMSAPTRDQLIAVLNEIAPSYGQDAEFVREFATNFGLDE